MLQAGESPTHVARLFGKPKSVIACLEALHCQTGKVKMRRGRGRHRKTTVQQNHFLRVITLRNRFITASEMKQEIHAATGLRFSNSTLCRRLHEVGLKTIRIFRGVITSRVNIRTRLHWCQQHQGWPIRRWRYVMFLDESRFCLRFTGGLKRVWRRCEARYKRNTILQHDSFGGGSLMVWGGVS